MVCAPTVVPYSEPAPAVVAPAPGVLAVSVTVKLAAPSNEIPDALLAKAVMPLPAS